MTLMVLVVVLAASGGQVIMWPIETMQQAVDVLVQSVT